MTPVRMGKKRAAMWSLKKRKAYLLLPNVKHLQAVKRKQEEWVWKIKRQLAEVDGLVDMLEDETIALYNADVMGIEPIEEEPVIVWIKGVEKVYTTTKSEELDIEIAALLPGIMSQITTFRHCKTITTRQAFKLEKQHQRLRDRYMECHEYNTGREM